MLSYFQKRKLTRYYNCIDFDAKGYFTLDDVDRIAIQLADKRNFPLSSEMFKLIRSGIRMIWSNARLYGYSQDPYKVILTDWLVHEDHILAREEMREGYMKKISRDVFDLIDMEGKSAISEHSYSELMQSFNVDPGVTEWCFKKMDVDKKGVIYREEFVTLVEQFHLSEDLNAPGNYLFGAF